MIEPFSSRCSIQGAEGLESSPPYIAPDCGEKLVGAGTKGAAERVDRALPRFTQRIQRVMDCPSAVDFIYRLMAVCTV